MNRPKNLTGNVFVATFFHKLKSDVIHGHPPRTATESDAVVRRYLARFNRTRQHSALACRSPIDFERASA